MGTLLGGIPAAMSTARTLATRPRYQSNINGQATIGYGWLLAHCPVSNRGPMLLAAQLAGGNSLLWPDTEEVVGETLQPRPAAVKRGTKRKVGPQNSPLWSDCGVQTNAASKLLGLSVLLDPMLHDQVLSCATSAIKIEKKNDDFPYKLSF